MVPKGDLRLRPVVASQPAVDDTAPGHRRSVARPRTARVGASAQSPTKSAWPVERAGLTEVLVTGIEIRWINVNARPIASGAKPAGARLSVTPIMMSTKKKVSRISAASDAVIV